MSDKQTPRFIRKPHVIPSFIAVFLLSVAIIADGLPDRFYRILQVNVCWISLFVTFVFGVAGQRWWIVCFFVPVAIIFNPSQPVVSLDHSTWKLVDIAVATAFIATVFTIKPEQKNE
jgi:hypothetical protein